MLAALVAMLGKQWLNRYLRHSGGSMIERCADRQRKCDGLEKWPLHSFVESLPLMLQVALLLLASGLCRHMWTINTPVAWTLTSLTGLGAMFYIGIVIAGISSYACPFQTPASIGLRGSWKRIRPGIASAIVHSKRALIWTRRMWKWRVRPLLRRPPLPTTVPLENVQVPESEPWLKPKDLSIIRRTNTDDVLCVSWIFRSITDPEAIDAALPLAGEIRWFDDGVNVNLPYDMIVSTFEACFDSTRRLYPGSRDRAYYSGRAILWINTLARCKSYDIAGAFPLPDVQYTTLVPDPDLEHLLRANCRHLHINRHIASLFTIDPGQTPSNLQWISSLLLHHFSANLTEHNRHFVLSWLSDFYTTETTIPLNVALNRILVWCTFFGSPIEEELLKVRNKSYDISCFCFSSCSPLFTSDRTEPILDRLSKAVLPVFNDIPTWTRRKLIRAILSDLVRLETTPERLTEITYEWCSATCKDRGSFQYWEELPLLCLEIGFRRLDFRRQFIKATITHTEHHQILVDVVFRSQKSEVIADLLHAWTTTSDSHSPAVGFLRSCASHLVGLQNLVPSSPRLRRLVIRSVELTGYRVFEGVGVERFIEFLNHLYVTTEDLDDRSRWVELLVGTIQSSEAPQHLSHSYWELLAELAVSSYWPKTDPTNGLRITTSLVEAEEWSRLECWTGVLWMLLPEDVDPTEEDLGHSMTLLFRQRPGAVQKLEQWMERWGRENPNRVHKSFQQLCKQAHEEAKQDAL